MTIKRSKVLIKDLFKNILMMMEKSILNLKRLEFKLLVGVH